MIVTGEDNGFARFLCEFLQDIRAHINKIELSLRTTPEINRGKAERSKTPPVTTGTGISAPASGAATAEYGMPDGTVVDPVVNDGNKDKLQRHRRRGRQRTPVLSGALQPREDDRAAEEEARGVPATGAEPSLPRLLQFLAEVP